MDLSNFFLEYWYLVALVVLFFCGLMWSESELSAEGGMSVSPDELIQKTNRQHAVLIDMRPPKAHQEGFIVGSLSVPDMTVDLPKKLEKNLEKKPLILLCDRGIQAKELAKQLSKKYASQQVHYLEGGMQAWSKASLPLKTRGEK